MQYQQKSWEIMWFGWKKWNKLFKLQANLWTCTKLISSQNWFDIEIDADENGNLVEDLTKKVQTKFLRSK